MSKRTAHIFLFLFDLFALSGIWLGLEELDGIVSSVSNSTDSLSVSNRFGFFLFAIILPVIHIYALCEKFFLKKVFKNYAAWINRVFILLFFVVFLSALLLSSYMRTYVERAGYQHCPEVDKRMTFSTYLMYTKNADICSQLNEDRKKKLATTKDPE